MAPCFGAQSYRAFGTAAEYAAVPTSQVAPLPDGVSFEQGACLGIPAITAHRCVHASGPADGRTIWSKAALAPLGCAPCNWPVAPGRSSLRPCGRL